MTWAIRYTREAERDIDGLDATIRRRVLTSIGKLGEAPRSAPNVRQLTGTDRYRLRVGDWRVIYTLDDAVLVVLVIRVAHRREVYRD